MTFPSDISSQALYLYLTQLWVYSQFLASQHVPMQCHPLKVSVTSLDNPPGTLLAKGMAPGPRAAPQGHQIPLACCDGFSSISSCLLRALTCLWPWGDAKPAGKLEPAGMKYLWDAGRLFGSGNNLSPGMGGGDTH